MMRAVNPKAGWIDRTNGKACLVMDCGHVILQRFEGKYQPPEHLWCEQCHRDRHGEVVLREAKREVFGQ